MGTRNSTKTRHNPKLVERLRQHYYDCFCSAVKQHWTAETYIERRNMHESLPTMTKSDIAEVWGYSRAFFDAVNGGALLEWRIGSSAGPDFAVKDFDTFKKATGMYPTHGAHFWAGTNDLFSEWKAL